MGGRARGLAAAAAFLLVWGVVSATIAAAASSLWWGFDLATHFRWQYTLGAAVGLLGSLVLRWRFAAAAAAVALLANGALVAMVLLPRGTEVAGETIRVGVMNVNAGNRRRCAHRV